MRSLLALALLPMAATAADVVDLGSRRELLVDDFLIGSKTGVELVQHNPVPRDVVLVCDKPWEGNISAYYTLFQDGDLFRIYYRGAHYDEATKKSTHAELTCYAESRDGLVWTKPELGLFEFQGSKANNIVMAGSGATHNFAPFKDENPNCKPEARYKALAGGTTLVKGKKKSCLDAYQSPDGIRWTKMVPNAVITDGAFDSQNLACYDTARGEYRAYWRYFSAGYTDERGWKPEGVRAIRTATSKDFIHWEHQADLRYPGAPPEHLYTNAIRSYDRAPHLFVGFPTRFQPKHQQVEPVFMSSRDGVNFKRWPEPLVPITAPKDRDGNRSNYMAHGLLHLPGDKDELSVFATEAYYKGPASRVRRFTFRVDGFVSAQAKAAGTIVTRPLTFQGSTLELNVVSQGPSRVEIQDLQGKAIPGFALEDCTPVTGDFTATTVAWKGGSLKALAGQPVQLKFELNRADLYSLKFSE